MSALSEEFQEARRLLTEAAKTQRGDVEYGMLLATIALGHAVLASAAPGTAAEARNDERGLYDAKAPQD